MKNAGELSLLCQAFKKFNLKTYLLKPHGTELSATCDFGHPSLNGDLAPKTLYKTYDEYGFRYVYLLLDEDAKEVLLIGPYFEKPPTAQERERLTKALTFTGKGARAASEYLLAIPYLDEKSPYLTLLYTFAEHIWQTPAFPLVRSTPQARGQSVQCR